MAGVFQRGVFQLPPAFQVESDQVEWFAHLSEPVRLHPGLSARYHQFFTIDAHFTPRVDVVLGSWIYQWSEPVREPIGTKAPRQAFFFWHPRTLLVPDVTVTLAATETNTDSVLIGIEAGLTPDPPLPSQEGANVVITEVPVQRAGAISIEGE